MTNHHYGINVTALLVAALAVLVSASVAVQEISATGAVATIAVAVGLGVLALGLYCRNEKARIVVVVLAVINLILAAPLILLQLVVFGPVLTSALWGIAGFELLVSVWVVWYLQRDHVAQAFRRVSSPTGRTDPWHRAR